MSTPQTQCLCLGLLRDTVSPGLSKTMGECAFPPPNQPKRKEQTHRSNYCLPPNMVNSHSFLPLLAPIFLHSGLSPATSYMEAIYAQMCFDITVVPEKSFSHVITHQTITLSSSKLFIYGHVIPTLFFLSLNATRLQKLSGAEQVPQFPIYTWKSPEACMGSQSYSVDELRHIEIQLWPEN